MSHHFAISCVVCSFRGASVIAAGRVRVGYVTTSTFTPNHIIGNILFLQIYYFFWHWYCVVSLSQTIHARLFASFATVTRATGWLYDICSQSSRDAGVVWGIQNSHEERRLCCVDGRVAGQECRLVCKAGVVVVIVSSQLHILHMHIVIYLLVLVLVLVLSCSLHHSLLILEDEIIWTLNQIYWNMSLFIDYNNYKVSKVRYFLSWNKLKIIWNVIVKVKYKWFIHMMYMIMRKNVYFILTWYMYQMTNMQSKWGSV